MKINIILAAGAIAMLASSASAQMWPLSEGTQEIQVNGFMQRNGPGGDYTELKLGYGYFIDAGVEIGPRFAMFDQDGDSSYGLDAYMEYHYPVADNLAPYAGFALGYFGAEEEAAATITVSAGCKFFMVEDLALDISLNHTVATGDVFRNDEEYDSFRSNLSLGLRFFY